MNFKTRIAKFTIANKDIYYKLSIAFGLFFVVPVTGFLYFAVKYEFLNDKYVPFFFITLLIFFLLGFRLLRKLFDHIRSISTTITKTVEEEIAGTPLTAATDELGNIVQSFRLLENELRNKFLHLEKKTAELATLKEFSDLCYMTFNSEDLLYIMKF
jgi:sensor histidine kinase YesM